MAKAKHPLVRRKKHSAAARVTRFWILFIVVLVVLGGGGFWLSTWPGFDAKSIAVEGNTITPSALIRDRAEIDSTADIWLMNVRAVARRVETLPYVKVARVYRALPNIVTIEVTERVPFAIVQTPASRVLVDSELRVLVGDTTGSKLPVFMERRRLELAPGSTASVPSLTELRDAELQLTAAKIDPAALALDKYDELVVSLRSGVRVLMGDDSELDRKIALIDPILHQIEKNERAISAIDLRAPNTPVVVYK